MRRARAMVKGRESVRQVRAGLDVVIFRAQAVRLGVRNGPLSSRARPLEPDATRSLRHDMKLRDITTWVTVPPTGIGGSFWVIVKVTTDDGIEGVGECYGIPFSGDVACRMVEDTFEALRRGGRPA